MNGSPTGYALKNLIDEIHPAPPSDHSGNTGDKHVVCIIFDPQLTNIAWVFNLEYPKGKQPGWGLIGGRADPQDKSVDDVGIREAQEEAGIQIKILYRVREGMVEEVRDSIARKYWRSVLICVAVNRGDPTIRALAEDGTPQTREFRWFPRESPPDRDALGENVYFKHRQTLLHPDFLAAMTTVEKYFKDDLAQIRAEWEAEWEREKKSNGSA